MATSTSDFLVGEVIGQGSFGTVYFAQFKATNQRVAIKVVDKQSLRKNESWMVNVLNEQRILVRLNDCCSAAIDLLASFHDDQFVYLVLPCCEGGDLRHVIACLPALSETDRMACIQTQALGLINAIEAIHSHHIIHADLKPDNVLLTKKGKVLLADFGSAVDEKEQSARSPSRLHGSPQYAAPEVIRAETEEITQSIDIWSYGCILYALWMGSSPFAAATVALTVERVAAFAEKAGGQLECIPESNLPDEWISLIQSIVVVAPQLRPTTSAIRSRLNSLCAGTDPGNVSALPDPEWLSRCLKKELKDGNAGWVSFLV